MRFTALSPLLLTLLFSFPSQADIFNKRTVLSAEQAIQFTQSETSGSVFIHFELANNVYLYQDKVKLILSDKSTYSNFAFTETPKLIDDPSFGKVSVYYHGATLKIDRSKLPTNTNNIQIKYQGCDGAIGLCYPPQKSTLNITPAL